ncbi:MAG: dihydrofolate reductase [Alphaproteobacteria bacterium]|nr:dihydrofolate reductase [Alphaproteobacteria bacterium]
MTKIAVWCRHKEDNIIGIGPNIPWHVSSDFKRFQRLTTHKALLVGQTTYESFPNRTLPNRKIFILTFEKEYQVSDPKNHFVIPLEEVNQIQEELYISGGASIYKLMMEKLVPDFIVDSVYLGDLKEGLTGNPVSITPSVQIMEKEYEKITDDFLLDNVATTIWAKKGAQIDEETLTHLKNAIYNY